MELEPRPIILKDFEGFLEEVWAEHIIQISSEEDLVATWSERDSKVAADLAEHRLGVYEEGRRLGVDDWSLEINLNTLAYTHIKI